MKKPIILIDIDEVLYPFVETWQAWAAENSKNIGDFEILSTEYDIDKHLPGYLEEMQNFIKTHDVLNVQPYSEAIKAINILSKDYTLIAVTARDIINHKETTQAWIAKHAPQIEDIIFTRAYFKATPQPKADVANLLSAEILIDDSAIWMEELPEFTKGYILERPSPLKSDSGAQSWNQILKDLGY